MVMYGHLILPAIKAYNVFMGLYTDMDLEDLVKENIKLTRENNKMLKRMRRSRILGTIFRILFFLLVSGALWFVYTNYVEEYYLDIKTMYQGIEEDVEKLKNIPDRFNF